MSETLNPTPVVEVQVETPEAAEQEQPTAETPATPAQPAKPVQPTAQNPGAQRIPKERFDAVNEKYRDLQDTHTTLSAQYQSAVTERDTLKNQADTATTRASQLETAMEDMLKTRMESLPDAMKDLIPDSLPVEQKLVWIEKAQAKGLFTQPSQTPLGSPTNPPSGGVTLDISNMSPGALLRAGYGQHK